MKKKSIKTILFLVTVMLVNDDSGHREAWSKAFPNRVAARKYLKETTEREINSGMFAERDKAGLCDGFLADNIAKDSVNIWDEDLIMTAEIDQQVLRVEPVPSNKPVIGESVRCGRGMAHYASRGRWIAYAENGAYLGETKTIKAAKGLIKDAAV